MLVLNRKLSHIKLPRKDTLLKHWLLFAAITAAIASRLAFWVITGRAWEDGLITVTHAVNAVSGLGLTHHPGEGHVHGFTSALSVLIPLIGECIQHGAGMFTLRVSSLVAAALTVIYAYLISRELKLSVWPTLFLLAYLSFDQNQIFYGMSGMETQVAVAVLLAGIFYVMNGAAIKSGLCLGLGLLARPDFLLWVIPALLYLWLRERKTGLRAGLITVTVVIPWVLFTWLYYGSPVPNTIRAKAVRFDDLPGFNSGIGVWLSWVSERFAEHKNWFWHYFTPFLENDFIIRTPIPHWLLALIALLLVSLAGLGVWSTRRVQGFYPAVAYVLIFFIYRVLFLPPSYYTWYLPPFMAVIAILAAAGLDRIWRGAPTLSTVLALGLALAFAIHMPFTFPLEATIQHQIEERVRKPMSEYLAKVVLPGQAVTSESAGYVGYYSHVTLYDYPGLTSPKSLAVLRSAPFQKRTLVYLIDRLQPEWLVLRPFELNQLQNQFPATWKRYQQANHFKVDVPLSHWGVQIWTIDEEFFVLHRTK